MFTIRAEKKCFLKLWLNVRLCNLNLLPLKHAEIVAGPLCTLQPWNASTGHFALGPCQKFIANNAFDHTVKVQLLHFNHIFWNGSDPTWLVCLSAFAAACFDLRQQPYTSGFHWDPPCIRYYTTVHSLHGGPDRHHQSLRSSPSPVCRWHMDSGFQLPWVCHFTPVHSVRLSRWIVIVSNWMHSNCLQSSINIEDGDSLASPTANYRHQSWCWLYLAVCITDSIWLFCGSAPDMQHSVIRM